MQNIYLWQTAFLKMYLCGFSIITLLNCKLNSICERLQNDFHFLKMKKICLYRKMIYLHTTFITITAFIYILIQSVRPHSALIAFILFK